MERANEVARKLLGVGEKSVVPTQDGGDPGSVKHFWILLISTFGIIIFGFVIAFAGWFKI